jgi:thioredoxin-like negative regulator of GroEL
MAAETRKQQLEKLLADDPNDAFLRYGLAMECASAGDDEAALRTLRQMFADKIEYVPAYQQAGQIFMRLDRLDDARETFLQGIALAKRVGNAHAAGEMEGFLDTLG